jgi:aminocarboxymuconate-semialdehyde decarboxylase
MRVIDTHFHWYPRSFAERLCGRSGYPRAERAGDGYTYLYNAGRSRLDLPAVWFDLDSGLAVMDATGHETAVVCTTGVLSGLLDQLPSAEAAEIAGAYNEEMAAVQRRHPGRFFGTATVPLQDTDRAIWIAEDAVERLGLHAINLPPMSGGEFVDAPRLDPFYARVASLGVPLIVHPTDIVYDDVLQGHAGAVQLTIGRLLDSSLTVLRLVFAGVTERHPGLTIIHCHAGGLLPYQAGRIDKNSRRVALAAPPSDHLRRMYVDTVAPAALTIRTAIEFYGVERILYGTDYPCWDPRAALRVIDEARLSPEQRTMIFERNAEAVLRLAVGAAGG